MSDFLTGRSVRYLALMPDDQSDPSASVPTTRGRGRPGYDVESLLAVAVDVFIERGYDGTSMEDLSRRLGIAKSAIYHHVQSKDELLSMAVNRAMDALFGVLDDTRRLQAPAIEKLERLIRGSVA